MVLPRLANRHLDNQCLARLRVQVPLVLQDLELLRDQVPLVLQDLELLEDQVPLDPQDLDNLRIMPIARLHLLVSWVVDLQRRRLLLDLQDSDRVQVQIQLHHSHR